VHGVTLILSSACGCVVASAGGELVAGDAFLLTSFPAAVAAALVDVGRVLLPDKKGTDLFIDDRQAVFSRISLTADDPATAPLALLTARQDER
jgi:hypothetical protein